MTPQEARKLREKQHKKQKAEHGISSTVSMLQQRQLTGRPLSRPQENVFRAMHQKTQITPQTKYAKANQIYLAIKYPWKYFWEDDKWHERKPGGGSSGSGGAAIQT